LRSRKVQADGSRLEATQLAERDVPDYIEADHNKMVATFARAGPRRRAVPGQMEPNLVVEFYSR
jgi:small subunit ribosomal protein S4